jgi:hypothetical protein
MRRRNREINIFNLSMLDVISGAMAAFLILVVVLMPYYRKEHIDYQAIIAQLRQQLDEAARRAQTAERSAREAQTQAQAAVAQARSAQAAAQQEAQRQSQRADALARELARTFLVLYVRWNTGDDVDLHVVDPSGAEFYYEAKTIPGRPGELSEDTTVGPGNEVWEVRDAPPGDYRVYAKLFAVKDARKPVEIQGRVFHRDGSEAFSPGRLAAQGDKVPIATVRVDAEGNVSLR